MSTSPWKLAFHFVVPGGILAGAALAAFSLSALPPKALAFLPFYPLLVLLLGLFLGWRFNRSRLLFALLALLLADRALAVCAGGAAAPLARSAAAVLLPLNLALIAHYDERGLFTPLGLLRLGTLLAQPAALALLFRLRPALPLQWFTRPLLDWPPLDRLPLTQPALAAALLAALLLALRFLRRPAPLEGGFVWALLVSSPPLALHLPPSQLTPWLATAGLILAAAVLETSHGMAFRDELTGLPARRALSEALLKVGRRYTVAMVDVDHFKKVNDRHGHDVGDQVLRMVAARLERVTGGGRPFRYGGEEFTVLFPGKTTEEALPHLEIAAEGFTLRHRRRPNSKPKSPPKRSGTARLAVTVSIGVAERQAERSRPAQVIKAADQALYRAKKTGRNRVCR